MDDPYNLERFVAAQNEGIYDHAVESLRRGHKTGHWMWFVFPQIAGLGQSPMSRRFAISSLEEAKAYLRHPVLGARADRMRGHRSGGPGWDRGADLWWHRRAEVALVNDLVPAGCARRTSIRAGARPVLRRSDRLGDRQARLSFIEPDLSRGHWRTLCSHPAAGQDLRPLSRAPCGDRCRPDLHRHAEVASEAKCAEGVTIVTRVDSHRVPIVKVG